MFKAIHRQSDEAIVILDGRWLDRLEALRALGRQDILVCPGCAQPVEVRAGAIRRRYFAHKHRDACMYGQDSLTLLAARAVLYEWLQHKWSDQVTLEYQPEDVELPRPVDCWVARSSDSIAYWIVDGTIQAGKREALQYALEDLDAHVHFVFVATMLSVAKDNLELVELTTTERDLKARSHYDEPITGKMSGEGGTLHYLDSEQQTITSYRGLHVVHPPAGYRGHRKHHTLDEMQVSQKTGAFVHPGEYEHLREWREAQHAAEQVRKEEEQRSIEARAAIRFAPSFRQPPVRPPVFSAPRMVSTNTQTHLMRANTAPPTCIRCGEQTRDYWMIDNATNTCECRRCLKEGRQ